MGKMGGKQTFAASKQCPARVSSAVNPLVVG